MYNNRVERSKAPELDLSRPLASGVSVLRAVLLSPRRFYLNFSAGGPLGEPAVFVALVSAVAAVLRLAMVLALGTDGADEVVILLAETAAFIVFSPLMVGVFAVAYVPFLRLVVGPEGDLREVYRQVYRMLAYAYAAMILAWIPAVGALAFTYTTLILMTLAILDVYQTSFIKALVSAFVGYVPSSTIYISLTILASGLTIGG